MRSKTLTFFNNCKSTIISNFDMFGLPPRFEVLNKQKFTTPIGCFFTILILGFTIAYFLTQFVILMQKSEPKLYQNEIYIKDSQPFPLYNDNFTLAITIADKNSQVIAGQLKYYNITVNHCVRRRIINNITGVVTIDLKCSQLPIAPCTSDDFDNQIQSDFFKSIRLGVVQCVNRTYLKQNPPILQGQIAGMIYQYIYVELQICKNNATYTGCASQDEIQTKLSSGHYSVYASDYLMQYSNPDIPYQQFIALDINSFSITTSKMITWKYKVIETTSDDGWFTENNRIDVNLQQSDQSESVELYNNDYLVYHYIQLDYKEQKVYRSYIRIQGILGQIGGIFQFFILIFSIILNPIMNSLMQLEIANELFRFPKKQQNIIDEIKDNPLSRTPISFEENNINENQEFEKLSTNLTSQCLIIFGCNKSKKKLFNVSKEKISNQLDIVNLLDKLQEVDCLKRILLNEEQIMLFDLLPKPIIKDYEQETKLTTFSEIRKVNSFKQINQKRLTQNPLKSYYDSFLIVSQNHKKSSIDHKLLQLIDKNIFQQFDFVNSSSQRRSQIVSPYESIRIKEDESILEPKIQKPK